MSRLRSFKVSDNENVLLIEERNPAYGYKRWYFEHRNPDNGKLTLDEYQYDSKKDALKAWNTNKVYIAY